jgi:Long-chain acyl-CoA synthetases (AMP-forming)
LKGTD